MSAGQLNQIAVGKETTWGTAVTPNKPIPVRFTGGMQTNIDIQDITPVKALLAKIHDTFIGKRTHEGSYEMDFFPDNPLYFIISALGSVSSALKGGESVVYNHTITESEAKMALTAEQVVGENVRRFAGTICQSFKVSGNTGEAITLEAQLKAKSQASATKITPTYLTARAFNWADASVKLGGVAQTNVVAFELEYSNNIEFQHALAGSNDPAFNYVKGSEVKGKIEFYLDNTSLAELNDYLAKTNNALDIVLTGAAIGVGSNNTITFTVPVITYTKAETAINEDFNKVTIEYQGIYDTATSKLISVAATNLVTAY